jgi:hypothetical protein
MPSKIEFRSQDPTLPKFVSLDPGESQPLLLGEAPMPVLIACDILDLKTAIFVPLGNTDMSPLFPDSSKNARPVLMEFLAEVGDGEPPLDVAEAGVRIEAGQIVISHFSNLFARN